MAAQDVGDKISSATDGDDGEKRTTDCKEIDEGRADLKLMMTCTPPAVVPLPGTTVKACTMPATGGAGELELEDEEELDDEEEEDEDELDEWLLELDDDNEEDDECEDELDR